MNKLKTKKIVIDLDNTLTFDDGDLAYDKRLPRLDVLSRLREYQCSGYEIVIHSARNMKTYAGNLGKINIHTLPVILKWLESHQVPFDEVVVGKPWCGEEGFYVDDRAIRPKEFVDLNEEQIHTLLKN
ncbi:capsular biosynthesis protein [Polynucleobacter paneuropaeus]|nr:capsular biosynthesis protein [Polynucleobacter paneuropaeus]MBT8638568.1 capsular biosynthesis protein [Polynucleobacter paneuropaeus]